MRGAPATFAHNEVFMPTTRTQSVELPVQNNIPPPSLVIGKLRTDRKHSAVV